MSLHQAPLSQTSQHPAATAHAGLEVSIHTLHLADSFSELNSDRDSFQRAFVDLVCDGRNTLGRVLDVGCGPDLPPYLARIGDLAEEHDGVDPFKAEVMRHPRLNRRFPGIVESVDLPAAYYDMAMAYNVAEHVPSGPPFFAAVRRALKPGGEFWLLTPHARHPFALLSNAVRLANVKKLFRGRIEGINEYPSYYRLNSARSIRRAVAAQSWSRLDIWYAPCAQWDRYFPRAMRAIPHAYDRLVGMRYGPAMLLLIARLTAEGDTR